ncbi:MAG TPA: hypothetical protein VLA19_30640, partial [Herpetosiphonaceae bacterium]|nr:hypothetical protein [Herpetosiphonaceae bacterium]
GVRPLSWDLLPNALLIPAPFSLVGLVIAARRPHNLIGWIFLVIGLVSILYLFADHYAVYTLVVRPGSLPGGIWLALLTSQTWALVLFPLVTFLPMMFPHGRLPSQRWRAVAWLTSVAIVAIMLGNALAPDALASLEDVAPVANPLAFDSPALLETVLLVSFVVLLGSMLASVTSLILRFRRARGAERQQLKWFAYAAVLLAISIVAGIPGGERLQIVLYSFAIPCFPVAVGMAILRHRLYDIDVLVNRALVYGALSALLAGVYFGAVVLLQGLARELTGQEESPLVVVVSTLAIAALFQPLRRRLQEIIDRRFYRRKYDAARTLQAFGTRLRDEVDLQMLTSDLLGVVEETLQPAHLSLWLRGHERTVRGGVKQVVGE